MATLAPDTLMPMLRLLLVALVLASLPLSWWWLRQRGAAQRSRQAALAALTLFLTFDLVVFGSFTRLTDSGLGCPDWPGCYGQASPVGAHGEISAAQSALPSGPVTQTKAWIEMIHRYLAMAVGVLIMVSAAMAWRHRRDLPHSPWWPTLTLAWVVVQGLFGKYTVTLKLYPAIVTAHLLGGIVLIGLLMLQVESFRDRAMTLRASRGLVVATLAAVVLQIALGGWVSTNYAVLACRGFPTCNGMWWPPMDAGQGFVLLRELGRAGHGGWLPFDALVAIHMAHRVFALVALSCLAALVFALWHEPATSARRYAVVLAGLALAQLATGLSNVVLDWPIAAALAHSAGAAALAAVLASLGLRVWRGSKAIEALAGRRAPTVMGAAQP